MDSHETPASIALHRLPGQYPGHSHRYHDGYDPTKEKRIYPVQWEGRTEQALSAVYESSTGSHCVMEQSHFSVCAPARGPCWQ
jgi:hypothetical protein